MDIRVLGMGPSPVWSISDPGFGKPDSSRTEASSKWREYIKDYLARLNRLLKKCVKDGPRGLKSARRIENERLIGTTKVVP
jgi:hypothetical protein